MVSAYLLSFVFIILLATGIFLFGYAARRASLLLVTFLEIVFGLLISTPLVLFIDQLSFSEIFSHPPKEAWTWLGGAALAGFIGGNYFSVLNLRTGGERINSLLSPAITACVVLAGIFWLDEEVFGLKIAGIAITLSAVTAFIFYKTGNERRTAQHYAAFWSGVATILCVTLSIIFSIKSTLGTGLSIMHAIWLRLLLALPFAMLLLLLKKERISLKNIPLKVFGAIVLGVIAQTILGAYLWFYCTLKIGLGTFQLLIATLPFFVYTADVYLFKRSKPSPYFLLTAVVAIVGIWMVLG